VYAPPCAPRPNPGKDAACLGYVDTSSQETFRHFFYRASDKQDALQSVATASGLTTMNEILQHPAETSLSVVEQLRLARNLASAVLKFHSTPWLRDYFSLRDLSFFRTGQDLTGCLRTLHIGLEFVQLPSVQTPMSVDDVNPSCRGASELSMAVEHAQLEYGIGSLTLWSLGVVFLQIGRWAAIDSPEDVSGVRKLLHQVSALGPRYRDLTEKCLDCDFGYGHDLSKPRLQQAVYENLVCELDDMIGSLELSEN